MSKKILLSVLIIMMFVFQIAYAIEFTDMKSENYPSRYFDAIEFLNKKGAINGYPDGTYKPANAITRAEAIKIIVTSFDLKMKNNNIDTSFDDVNGKWCEEYVKIGVSNGILKGYEDGTFRPNDNINYGELVTIISRIKGKEVSDTTANAGEWYVPYMELAEEMNWFEGYFTNDLIAISRARRDNVALIIYNALNEKAPEKEEKLPTPTPTKASNSSSIDTKKVYSGVAGERFTERGSDYITIDCFEEGEMTFKVVNLDKMPANKSLVLFKINSSGNTSLQKEFKIKSIERGYLLVAETEEELVAFDGINNNMDVTEKTFEYDSKVIKINKMDYYLAEVEENKDGEYEFVGCREVSLEDNPFEEDDRVFFDSDKWICIIVRGIESEE